MGIFEKVGGKLERFKFGVYLLVPVLTVIFYSMPAIHEGFLTERRYIVYVPSDLPTLTARKKSKKDGHVSDDTKSAGLAAEEGQAPMR
jgi:hypothetical protein